MLLSACPARLPYKPVDLEEQAARVEFQNRAADDATLVELVRASGYEGMWPPEQWRLDTLTLLALYFNPEVDVARAQALASRASLSLAAKRSPLSVELAAEHHSREVDGTPWTIGVAVGLPIGSGSRREARVDRATYIADAAEIEIAAVMWRVRGATRDAIVDLTACRQRARLLEKQISVRRQLVKLMQRRVDTGMLSARDLGRERTELAAAEAELAVERTRQVTAYGDLAAALGLPLETVQSLKIADDAIKEPSVVPEAGAARSRALRNRLDIHVRLLEFGAADAEVRLAVAEQYPIVRISPGFFWDQGDEIWELASLVVPPASAQAAVLEAEARREVAARRFMALQIRVIGEVERSREVLQVTHASVTAGQDVVSQAQSQFERVRRYFDSGGGDRVQLETAHLATVQAQQHLLEVQIASYMSAARFEDAMQVPVLGDFLNLPDLQAIPGASS